MTEPAHPMQPVRRAKDGVIRFRPNKVVSFLLDWASSRGMNLNDLARIPFDDDEREQFAQLIGYSVCGFGELSYTSDEVYQKAQDAADQIPSL